MVIFKKEKNKEILKEFKKELNLSQSFDLT